MFHCKNLINSISLKKLITCCTDKHDLVHIYSIIPPTYFTISYVVLPATNNFFDDQFICRFFLFIINWINIILNNVISHPAYANKYNDCIYVGSVVHYKH